MKEGKGRQNTGSSLRPINIIKAMLRVGVVDIEHLRSPVRGAYPDSPNIVLNNVQEKAW